MVAQPSPIESDHAQGSESPPVDERAAFLEALVKAMRATATAEGARVAHDIERRRANHVAAVNVRREAEATRMRELADEDRRAINRWAADERTRVQLERERRTQELLRDLDVSLAEHGSKIDQEIQRADAAIAAYRAEVAGFFAALHRETDPVAIATQAVRRPRFPALDAVVAEAVVAEAIEAAPVKPSPAVAPMEAPVAAVAAVAAPAEVTVPAEATVPEEATVADAVTVTDEVTIPIEAPAIAVMDELAVKRAQWWATWKDLPDPPEPPEVTAVLTPVGQADPSAPLRDAVTVGAAPKESDAGSHGQSTRSHKR